MNRQHHQNHSLDRNNRRRLRSGTRTERHHSSMPFTDEGVPAAAPDAPKPSPVVSVSDESSAKYPWLPRRAIAGSVWRGPHHERVRVDERGEAVPYRCGPAIGR